MVRGTRTSGITITPIHQTGLFRLVLTLIAGLWGVALYRLHFGVDFTDEALYAALPRSFLLGVRPFLDEVALHQSFGLLNLPLVALHEFFLSRFVGLILFLRYCYLFVQTGLGILCYFTFRPVCGRLPALFSAGMTWAFVPDSIAALSYNTWASFFLAAGLLLTDRNLTEKSRPSLLGQFCFFLAGLVYPPLILVWVFTSALVFFLSRKKLSLRETQKQTTFFVGTAVLLGALITWAGPHNLAKMYHFSQQYGLQGGGTSKLLLLAQQAWRDCFQYFLTFFLTALFLCLYRRYPQRSGALFPLLSLWLVTKFGFHWEARSSVFVANFLCLLVGFGLLISENSFRKHLYVWPSLLAGLITTWSSGSGLNNFSVGAYPLLLLLFPWAWAWMNSVSFRIPIYIVSSTMILFLFSAQYLCVTYRDTVRGPTFAGALRVTDGPFAGLRTSQEKVEFIEKLRRDLGKLDHLHLRSVVFYPAFPAGYLFIKTPPAGPTVFIPVTGSSSYQHLYLEYFQRKPPGAFFEFKKPSLAYGKSMVVPELFQNLGDKMHYTKWLDSQDYQIWLEPLSKSKESN